MAGWTVVPNGDTSAWKPVNTPAAPPEPSMLQKAGGAIGDVVTGAGKGLLHTVSGADDWMRAHGPAFMTNSNLGFGPPANLEHVKQMATPEGIAQKIGYGGEQVGEFLAPGGLEKKGAAKLAELVPWAGRAAKPLAKVLTSGISAGAVNSAQGGSPITGAAMGAGGQIIGQGLKAAAPVMAETALGLPKAARAFGKTPGTALLDETRGIRPSTIAGSAQERLGELNPQLESAASSSRIPASLLPARGIVSDAASKAANQNAEGLFNQLGKQGDFLDYGGPSGEVTPQKLLDLKRGFNEEHLRWNPEMHDRALSTGRQAYNALDQELDRTVPESAGLNQRISSLIPVAQRAESISRGAPTLQRAAQRFGAHTGALTLGGIGGYQGYREGGVPGAIAGGLTGVLAPELIASPEGQMALARTLYKMNGLRPLVGSALQLDRNKEKQ